MELTQEEINLVSRRRSQKTIEIEKKQRGLALIELAAKYKKYLNDTGTGKSYSDFCSSMGHDYGELDYIGWKGNRMYSVVCEIIDYAEKCG